jgi:hypothetical protein
MFEEFAEVIPYMATDLHILDYYTCLYKLVSGNFNFNLLIKRPKGQ